MAWIAFWLSAAFVWYTVTQDDQPPADCLEPNASCVELISAGSTRKFECVYKDGTHFIHVMGDTL